MQGFILRKLTHIHHIIPKHMGGTNDPSNLVELTVADHAAAHRILFEQYGKIQDYIAWQGLEGRIDKEEAIRLLLSRPRTSEHNANISKSLKGKLKTDNHKQALRKPKIWTEEGKQRLSEASSSRKNMLGKKHSAEAKQQMSEAAKNRPRVECPHCGIIMGINNAKKYHFDKCKRLE